MQRVAGRHPSPKPQAPSGAALIFCSSPQSLLLWHHRQAAGPFSPGTARTFYTECFHLSS